MPRNNNLFNNPRDNLCNCNFCTNSKRIGLQVVPHKHPDIKELSKSFETQLNISRNVFHAKVAQRLSQWYPKDGSFRENGGFTASTSLNSAEVNSHSYEALQCGREAMAWVDKTFLDLWKQQVGWDVVNRVNAQMNEFIVRKYEEERPHPISDGRLTPPWYRYDGQGTFR